MSLQKAREYLDEARCTISGYIDCDTARAALDALHSALLEIVQYLEENEPDTDLET